MEKTRVYGLLSTLLLAFVGACAPAGSRSSAQISVRVVPDSVASLDVRASNAIVPGPVPTPSPKATPVAPYTGLSADVCYFLHVTGEGVPLQATERNPGTCDRAIPGLGRIIGAADRGDVLRFNLPLGRKTIDLVAIRKSILGFADACKNHRVEFRPNGVHSDGGVKVELFVDGRLIPSDDNTPSSERLIARGVTDIRAGENVVDLVARWGQEGAEYGCHQSSNTGPVPPISNAPAIPAILPTWSLSPNQEFRLTYTSHPSFLRVSCGAGGNNLSLRVLDGAHGSPIGEIQSANCTQTSLGGIAEFPNLPTHGNLIYQLIESQSGIEVARQVYRVQYLPGYTAYGPVNDSNQTNPFTHNQANLHKVSFLSSVNGVVSLAAKTSDGYRIKFAQIAGSPPNLNPYVSRETHLSEVYSDNSQLANLADPSQGLALFHINGQSSSSQPKTQQGSFPLASDLSWNTPWAVPSPVSAISHLQLNNQSSTNAEYLFNGLNPVPFRNDGPYIGLVAKGPSDHYLFTNHESSSPIKWRGADVTSHGYDVFEVLADAPPVGPTYLILRYTKSNDYNKHGAFIYRYTNQSDWGNFYSTTSNELIGNGNKVAFSSLPGTSAIEISKSENTKWLVTAGLYFDDDTSTSKIFVARRQLMETGGILGSLSNSSINGFGNTVFDLGEGDLSQHEIAFLKAPNKSDKSELVLGVNSTDNSNTSIGSIGTTRRIFRSPDAGATWYRVHESIGARTLADAISVREPFGNASQQVALFVLSDGEGYEFLIQRGHGY